MENSSKTITSPVKAIRAKCKDCMCDQINEIKSCPIEDCPLYPFRFGKNPFAKKREYSDEQKQIMAERLANIRNIAKKS